MPTAPAETRPPVGTMRDDFIRLVRKELRRRSGRLWSVTGGRGTAWGWVTIQAPPARRVDDETTREDADALADLLNLDRRMVGHAGVTIPPERDYRTEYADRVRGLTPSTIGVPGWD